MTNLSSTLTYGTYLDLAETVAWMQFAGGVSELPTAQEGLLQRVIDSACTQAQQIAGRPLGASTCYERHDGWSGEDIMLTYSPVLSLTKCVEWQSSGGPITLPESTPANAIEGVQIDYSIGLLRRVFAGYSWPRPFFPGSRNIEITYVAGFNPVPADVWEKTVQLVAYIWRNSQQASRSGGPAPRGMDDFGGIEPTTGLWPGVPNHIAAVFESYRLPYVG